MSSKTFMGHALVICDRGSVNLFRFDFYQLLISHSCTSRNDYDYRDPTNQTTINNSRYLLFIWSSKKFKKLAWKFEILVEMNNMWFLGFLPSQWYSHQSFPP